jgi:uncharacterized protein (DUF305 family)
MPKPGQVAVGTSFGQWSETMEKRLHRRSFHPSIRHSVSLGAIALALGLAGSAEFLASAHDGPQHDGLQALPHLRTTTDAAIGEEASFLAENGVAMNKMMNEMTVKPSGDVDRDFVAMMVPHHQGAIDMALAVLRYGRNAQIRRLAQEIIVTQQQEIAAMRLAVGDPLPPSIPSPTQARPALDCR